MENGISENIRKFSVLSTFNLKDISEPEKADKMDVDEESAKKPQTRVEKE